MNKLIDRVSINSNRRKLKVIDLIKENGEIKELVVDMERDDMVGNSGVTGTKLTAQNLEEIISQLIEEIILKYDLKKEPVDPPVDTPVDPPVIIDPEIIIETDKTTDYWIQSNNEIYEGTFTISSDEVPIYVRVISEDPQDKIKINNITGNGSQIVKIKVIEDIYSDGAVPTDWQTITQNFVVGVYLDEEFTQLCQEITYTVYYTFHSDNYVDTLFALYGSETYLSGASRYTSYSLRTASDDILYTRIVNQSDDMLVDITDDGTDRVNVGVTIFPDENASTVSTYEVTIDAFNSSQYTTKLGTITLTVYYTPDSMNPID